MKQLFLALTVTVALSVMAACETRPENTAVAPAAQDAPGVEVRKETPPS